MAILTSSGGVLSSGGIILSTAAVVPPAIPALPDFELDSYKPGTNTDNIALALGAGGSWDDNKILHPCAVSQGGTVYLFYTGYSGSVWAIGVASVSSASFTGLNLSKYGSNPILEAGAGGAWDDGGVFDPWVIYDAAAATWKMWYRGYDGTSLHKIGYATASNPLGPWTKYGSNPVLSSAGWEGNLTILPNVMRRSATDYVMLYTGNEPASTNGRIGLATSTDGVAWTKEASNPVLDPAGADWMAASVFSPRTLVLEGSTYKLYFSAKQNAVGYSSSGYAYSSDLISWTVPAINPLLTSTRTWEGAATGEIENPNAIHVGTSWYIFYDTWFGSPSTIGVAIVAD